MNLTTTELALVVVALFLVTFGALVLFSDKFFEKMEHSLWKRSGSAHEWFSEAEAKSFNRYGRGLGAFLAGLILLVLIVLKHFK
jgi:hypothetical protein